ncbi:MAG: hypothetical protein KC636_27480 [Myxococcales bacterium]|nr:hypothetical protein [Myxococcales bacterium]
MPERAMNYAELLRFDPIETVVELRAADQQTRARRLVETFVISRRMGARLIDVALPLLRLDGPTERGALLVVGDYGAGKSHLMATLSAVAERASLVTALAHPAVADAAASIAGRFVVVRAELNASMPLRAFVMETLREQLADRGITFTVPPEERVRDHKDVLAAMMAAFTAARPDHGLLLVVDELLDYLRANDPPTLVGNLNFLRALAEFCQGSRLRFVAGVQQRLFDDPRLEVAADSLRRVRDRFAQLQIDREDLAHVVAERLVKKDATQAARVREHLTKFAALYGTMHARMDEFVRLFPVHPAFLDVLARLRVVEKRELLKTLSALLRPMLDAPVPSDAPGLIAYDAYWTRLCDDPSLRSLPEVRAVIERVEVLAARVQQALPRRQYRPVAQRIVHALAVARLTTSDLHARQGVTAEALRDDLCLALPLPERDAEFLKTAVETVLRELVRAVRGQFITLERGQYFLELTKDIDYDARVDERAAAADDDAIAACYLEGLRDLLVDDPDARPVTAGDRVWPFALEWRERNVERSGYLCLGAPEERPTALPARDFYLHLLRPRASAAKVDASRPDEVLVRLRRPSAALASALRRDAGARALAAASAPGHKEVYEDKAREHRQAWLERLQEEQAAALELLWQGERRALGERRDLADEATDLRDAVRAAAAAALSEHFVRSAPDYPRFRARVPLAQRGKAVRDALRRIVGDGRSSRLGALLLDGLELGDGDASQPQTSRYARHLLALLDARGDGQVLNRAEVMQARADVEHEARFRLEPDLLAVVIAALALRGEVSVRVPGATIEAGDRDGLARRSAQELARWEHLERPRALPLPALAALQELLDEPADAIVDPARRDEAIARLRAKLDARLRDVVLARARVPALRLLGAPLLRASTQATLRARLDALRGFLESLPAFTSARALARFTHDRAAVQGQRANLAHLAAVEELAALAQRLGPASHYLDKAAALLPSDHPWVAELHTRRDELVARIDGATLRPSADAPEQLLAALKRAYQDVYLEAHARARLDAAGEARRARALADPRRALLEQLSSVTGFPGQRLHDHARALLELPACAQLERRDLALDPLCPRCGYRPLAERDAGSVDARLDELDAELDAALHHWTAALRDALQGPEFAGERARLEPQARALVDAFVRDGRLPSPLPPVLTQALARLELVYVDEARLRAALVDDGAPCTVDALQGRLARLLTALLDGRDRTQARIVVTPAARSPDERGRR